MSFSVTVEGGTSVRLPTAGKYCDRDIIVTAEGGGVELDVVTASSLPAAVTDGQIVVITNTTPGTVYIDTDEPASPATGDVWVQMDAGGDAALELTEESPYMRCGLKAAAKWGGTEWVYCVGYLGEAGAWKQFSIALPPIGTALNDCTWEQISKIAASGKGSEYFAVGDAKEIKINGSVGNTSFSEFSIYAFILGFDHNSEIEGSNTIHFQIGKNAQIGGSNVCLTDAKYKTSTTSSGYFSINTDSVNTGGWESCPIRNALLGAGDDPNAPTAGRLIAALPSDLRSVMRGVVKYTDNTGGGKDTASYVTSTFDYLWFLAEYEIFGKRTYANSAEQQYQKQYDYYASGNPKTFASANAAIGSVHWWMRSPRAAATSSWQAVADTGVTDYFGAALCMGIAPAFCV